MATFFTADTHFGHSGCLSLYRRPFASVAEMNAAMRDRWNDTVSPNDDVWHLGDFALQMAPPETTNLLDRLNGRKHLITGNNDLPSVVASRGWVSVMPYFELSVDGAQVVLCHYAFRTWNGMAKGVLNLHGHSHGRLKPQPRQFDVGVDVWDFRPITVACLLRAAGGSRTRAS